MEHWYSLTDTIGRLHNRQIAEVKQKESAKYHYLTKHDGGVYWCDATGKMSHMVMMSKNVMKLSFKIIPMYTSFEDAWKAYKAGTTISFHDKDNKKSFEPSKHIKRKVINLDEYMIHTDKWVIH